MTELIGTAVNAKLVPEAASAASLSSPLQRSWGHSCATVRSRPQSDPPLTLTDATGATLAGWAPTLLKRSSTASACDLRVMLCMNSRPAAHTLKASSPLPASHEDREAHSLNEHACSNGSAAWRGGPACQLTEYMQPFAIV